MFFHSNVQINKFSKQYFAFKKNTQNYSKNLNSRERERREKRAVNWNNCYTYWNVHVHPNREEQEEGTKWKLNTLWFPLQTMNYGRIFFFFFNAINLNFTTFRVFFLSLPLLRLHCNTVYGLSSIKQMNAMCRTTNV